MRESLVDTFPRLNVSDDLRGWNKNKYKKKSFILVLNDKSVLSNHFSFPQSHCYVRNPYGLYAQLGNDLVIDTFGKVFCVCFPKYFVLSLNSIRQRNSDAENQNKPIWVI